MARPVVEALAHAGAFDALPHRRTAAATSSPRSRPTPSARGTSSGCDGFRRCGRTSLRPDGPRFAFRDYTDAEVVRAELEVLGLDATRHVATLLRGAVPRPRGDVLGGRLAVPRRRVGDGGRREGRLADPGDPQRPADHLPDPRRRHRAARDHGVRVGPAEGGEDRLPRVRDGRWGQVRRTGKRGVSVVAEDVWDLTALHRARGEGRLREAMAGPVQPTSPDRRPLAREPRLRGMMLRMDCDDPRRPALRADPPRRPRRVLRLGRGAEGPSLRGKPVIVGGRGARRRDERLVRGPRLRRPSAMPSVRARRLCPEGIFVSPDFEAYRTHSTRFREVLLAHTPLVEPISLDEAFLDVGGPPCCSASRSRSRGGSGRPSRARSA